MLPISVLMNRLGTLLVLPSANCVLEKYVVLFACTSMTIFDTLLT